MKDKCIIKSADKPCGNCLIRVTPSVHKQIQALCLKTCRSATSVASELLDFALERVEIEYKFDPDDNDSDSEQIAIADNS